MTLLGVGIRGQNIRSRKVSIKRLASSELYCYNSAC